MSDLHSPVHTEDDVPVDRTVKVPHLVFGLFFLGAAAIWALVAAEVITTDRLAVLGPGVLIAAGVIGLAASLANSRNRHRARPTPTAPHGDHQTDPRTDSQTDNDTQEIR